jgi:hypothetical protein
VGLRNLGRVGRLRWVAGRRTPEENWDAYEAATGRPLLKLARSPQSWTQVRFWLLDLARELQAAAKDGTAPGVLALDRVWITADGRAKLLDFPAPGLGPDGGAPAAPGVSGETSGSTGGCSAEAFLDRVARTALEGRTPACAEAALPVLGVPLPLSARDFLGRLPGLPGPAAVLAGLEPLLQQVAAVTRLRRAGLVAACAVFPVIAGLGVVFGTAMVARWERQQPGIWELSQLLNVRGAMRMPWVRGADAPDDRTFAIYIASHHRAAVTNPSVWSSMFALAMIQGRNRAFAEKAVADYPAPTEEEVEQATRKLQPLLGATRASDMTKHPWVPWLACGVSWIVYVAIPALLAALLFRGGLVLRALRVAVVRRDGRDASRLRVLWRAVVAWSPVLLAPALIGVSAPALGVVWASVLAVLLVGLLTAWSLALPERSLQDRLAGTCLVPR